MEQPKKDTGAAHEGIDDGASQSGAASNGERTETSSESTGNHRIKPASGSRFWSEELHEGIKNCTKYHLKIGVDHKAIILSPFEERLLLKKKKEKAEKPVLELEPDILPWENANILTRWHPFRIQDDSWAAIALFPVAVIVYFLLVYLALPEDFILSNKWPQPLPGIKVSNWLAGAIIIAPLYGAVIYRSMRGKAAFYTIAGIALNALLAAVPPLLAWPHRSVLSGVDVLLFLTIVLLASFPALMFFNFDRQQLATLKQEFYRSALRLQSKLRTTNDVDAAYGDQMSEAYGTEKHARLASRDNSKQPGRTAAKFPIALATVLLSVGLTLVFLPLVGHKLPFWVLPQQGQSHGHTVSTLLSHITFGFMGSYFLGLGQVLRGHVRRDLHPKTYSQLIQSLIVTAIVCSLLSTAQLNWSDDSNLSRSSTLLMAFIAGIAPMEVLMHLFIVARIRFPSLKKLLGTDPFSGLKGIDIYERRRLELEGINNTEALAHCDLISLMLQTRIPADRLVEWVDQAILHLHVRDKISAFRAAGILNATDLKALSGEDTINLNDTSEDDRSGAAISQRLIRLLTRALEKEKSPPADPKEFAADLLHVVMAAIEDDEWFLQIWNWRQESKRQHDTPLKILERPEDLYGGAAPS